MCMHVWELPSSRSESILVKSKKWLDRRGIYFITPFMSTRVSKNGILAEPDMGKIVSVGSRIDGGYIHSYIDHESDYYDAYAINVRAYEGVSLVCHFLYIPEADKTGNSNKIVKKLEKVLDKGENMTWKDILKIFPNHVDYFKYNVYYNIDVQQKGQNMSKNSFKVDWTKMIQQENVSTQDIQNFALGTMSRRSFERLSTTARKAVRELGAQETRKRARKALGC